MYGRRRFLECSAGAAVSSGVGLAAGCAPAGQKGEVTAGEGATGGGMAAYLDAARRMRETLWVDPEMTGLVNCATLAANGHNTQAWRFVIRDGGVGLWPDFSRRMPVADPDDHHLFVSLGCAAENLLVAATARGRAGAAAFRDSGEGGGLDIDFASGAVEADDAQRALYAAIPKRQSTRAEYAGGPLAAEELRQLEAAAAEEGVSLLLLTDPARFDDLIDFVTRGHGALLDNPAFIDELRRWVRFNPAHALKTRDGLFGPCVGNDAMAPAWLGRLMFRAFIDKDADNEKYARQIRSSAGVAVFVGDRADPDHWMRVGRSFQRFALAATAMGVKHAHINQPIERPDLRAAFARWLGIEGRRPDLVIRFGRGPDLPFSLRRSAPQVMTG